MRAWWGCPSLTTSSELLLFFIYIFHVDIPFICVPRVYEPSRRYLCAYLSICDPFCLPFPSVLFFQSLYKSVCLFGCIPSPLSSVVCLFVISDSQNIPLSVRLSIFLLNFTSPNPSLFVNAS